jgi:arylsulfatase B
MSGQYPSSIGMQHFVILPEEPWGLSLKDPIMPEIFKKAGYKTHLVGKWHLGFFQQQYTPTKRGFDSFFGYLGAHIDYYSYIYKAFYSQNWGYDMRKNLSVNYDFQPKTYITEAFTEVATDLIRNHDESDPLFLLLTHLAPHSGNEDDKWQAPEEEILKFSHIDDPERRKLAG